MVRRFTITRTYPVGDVEFLEDALNVTLTDENGKVILSGDWYHDSIDEKIDGFFVALNYLGVKYECEVVRLNEQDEEDYDDGL